MVHKSLFSWLFFRNMVKENSEDQTSDSEASNADASESDASDPTHPACQIDFPLQLNWTDGWIGMCLNCCADGR
jgi:hypothetical protein